MQWGCLPTLQQPPPAAAPLFGDVVSVRGIDPLSILPALSVSFERLFFFPHRSFLGWWKVQEEVAGGSLCSESGTRLDNNRHETATVVDDGGLRIRC